MQEILSVAEMSAADRAAMAAGVPSLDLMEAAGAAVVREIAKRWSRRPAVIMCGPGNNGGDGFVIARLLQADGWPVRVALLGGLAALKGDAAVNARRWQAAGGATAPLDAWALGEAALAVDALFGAGLRQGLNGSARDAVERINARGLDCVAVDLPSGVAGDSGLVLADPDRADAAGVAPRCRLTVTFFRPKPAHLLYPGRALCGELVVADIGIPESVLGPIAPKTFVNGPGLWSFPAPAWHAHKYVRGHAIVFGAAEMTGAARLAARGARRIGAGLLTLAVPGAARPIYAAEAPGAFVTACDTPEDAEAVLADPRRNAVLLGPGFGVGPITCTRALGVLDTKKAVVLDADALTSFAAKPEILFSAIKARPAPTVLTPHDGEFARLFGRTLERIPGKLARARAAAEAANAVIILKGPDTVIAAPGGRAAINATGTPWLATGGSGDVLAGFVLGLLAQGCPPWEAAAMAVWLHGRCAEAIGPGLLAEDLPDTLPRVLNDLINK
jgi:NAD(P)H-hydrate epimerase